MPQPAVTIQPAASAVRRQVTLARALALLVQLRELERDDLRNAAVIHRHPVEHVDGLDRPAVVRDHDELRAIGELAERLRETADVPFVERGIDLVEDAERRRLHAEDREQERRGGEGALAARELREAADALSGGTRVDLDARILRIVGGPERRLPAVEQALEEDAELAVDRHERRGELLGDRRSQIVGERAQIGHRLLEIGALRGEELVTLADLGELRGGERIHRLERDQAATQALERRERAALFLLVTVFFDRDRLGIW